MANDFKNDVKILRQAMLNEIEGVEFYKLAAEKFKPSETKEALLELAAQEEQHYDFLLQTADKLSGATDKVSFDPKTLKEEVPSPDIFNWGNAEEDEDMVKLAVTVFSVGMGMEKDSIAFYEEALENAQSDEAKALYKLLIEWEESHLYEFRKQYDIYRQSWWNMQNFEPY